MNVFRHKKHISIWWQIPPNATQRHLSLARRYEVTQCQSVLPWAWAARQQCKAIITLRQGGIGAEDYPCNSQILLGSEPLSKTVLIHFLALHSSPQDPWAACGLCGCSTLAATSPCGEYGQLGHHSCRCISEFYCQNLTCNLIFFSKFSCGLL